MSYGQLINAKAGAEAEATAKSIVSGPFHNRVHVYLALLLILLLSIAAIKSIISAVNLQRQRA